MDESLQDYSWIQDFEADFLYNSGFWGRLSIESASKSWIKQILIAFFKIYFQFIYRQLTI